MSKHLREENINQQYLADFAERSIEFLERKINEQQQKEEKDGHSELEVELDVQQRFQQQKRENFTGQAAILERIEDYINNEQERRALILYGRSGVGKSSIMAQAIEHSIQKNRKVLFRFIGATPNSVYVKELLGSIFQELKIDISRDTLPEHMLKMDPLHIPDSFYGRVPLREFSERIEKRFLEITDEIVLFIDAVDQLSDSDSFHWLPEELPANLKVVISVVSDKEKEFSRTDEEHLLFGAGVKRHHHAFYKKDDDGYLNDLLFRSRNIDFIGDFQKPVELLRKLLAQEGRAIQKQQEAYFVQQFRNSPTPFYVYVAAQEMKHWKSYDRVAGQAEGEGSMVSLADSQEGIVRDYIENLSTIYHHDRQMVQKVLGYIYASQDGLSEGEILELLSFDKTFVEEVAPDTWHENLTKKVPVVIWTRLLDDLRPFLTKKSQLGEELIRFFHREFTEVIVSNSTQQEEHENIIKAAQEVLLKQDYVNTRSSKLYIYLITEYYLLYKSNLRGYSVFIAESGLNDHWLEQGYIDYLLNLSDQFKSYNAEGKTYKHAYLLSATFTTEALFHENPDRWNKNYLRVLRKLTEVYEDLRDYSLAKEIATIALQVAEIYYQKDPETYTSIYLSCQHALAWSNRTLDEEEAIRLFKELELLTRELCDADPDQWSAEHVRSLTTLGVLHRRMDDEQALIYHKAALDIAKVQYDKFPKKWEKRYKKSSSNYHNFLRYNVSLLTKMKHKMKRLLK